LVIYHVNLVHPGEREHWTISATGSSVRLHENWGVYE